MHIYFSGIGGTAIGPLAMIAAQAGYKVSGSDKQDSQYIQYLRTQGINDIHIGQSYDQISESHSVQPIDWLVHTSALTIEDPNAPELQFCKQAGIKVSKRDELLNQIINDKQLKLIAIAGTHGKTTTTAMVIWLFKQLGIPVSYSVGAKISFGEMGQYVEGSEYFVYEADEFDHNFLAFEPYLSLITGVDYDHHEQFPTREAYNKAFQQFLSQSNERVVWNNDAGSLGLAPGDASVVLDDNDTAMNQIELLGLVNRQDAWLAVNALASLTNNPIEQLINLINKFPGLDRRFERISDNLYSDYAHTIEKIRGCLQTAHETSNNITVVYEPLTNRRQYYIKDGYKDLFKGVKKLYWVPSYLAREDPDQPVLSPKEFISGLSNRTIAEPAELNAELKQHITERLIIGDTVVCISGGGGGSLDEWLRAEFKG
ncbi:MAG: Mur ligase domain-containing protein [Candidatus Saccharimonadales bacterium]